jgi:hypothetical protein
MWEWDPHFRRGNVRPGTVARACNPGIWERVHGQPGLHRVSPKTEKKTKQNKRIRKKRSKT